MSHNIFKVGDLVKVIEPGWDRSKFIVISRREFIKSTGMRAMAVPLSAICIREIGHKGYDYAIESELLELDIQAGFKKDLVNVLKPS